MVSIVRCSCYHEYQDTLYGAGLRVHNYAPKHGTNKAGAWRCTVCGKEKDATKATIS